MDFQSFQKIPRFFRDIVVTEKLDGTNAQVYIPENPDEPVLAGSRNRWLSLESDNFGFAHYVHENSTMLRRLGPGRHFGEWWGQGIQRRYGLNEKRFWLFNTGRWEKGFPEGLPANMGTVPVLYHGDFDTHKIDSIMTDLVTNGSKAVPGWMQPEGIVIYHVQSRQLYKVTLEGDGKVATKPKQRGTLDLPPEASA